MRKSGSLNREIKESYAKMVSRIGTDDVDVYGIFVSGYRSGYNKHREMITKKNGKPLVPISFNNAVHLHRIISGSIKSARKAHPELSEKELTESIAKRIMTTLSADKPSYANVKEDK